MAHKVIFRDCFKIVQPSEEQKAIMADSFGDTPSGKGLFVYMEATHSAIGNRNNRFYLPSKMQSGADTFLGKKGKTAPILKHHGGGMMGGDQDPVGKVRSVEYVPTIPETLNDSEEVDLLTDNSVPLRKQVRAARRFLRNDFVLDSEWAGLGYIKLGTEILDPKAIQQVKDGLFDSVSVSFGTNHAFCSICGSDWASGDDGPCEHRPGEVYEDEDSGTEEKAFLIPGDMKFRECSLVNFDADPHTAISIASNMGDAEDVQTFSDDAVYDIRNISWEIKDSEGRTNMKKIDVQNGDPIELSDAEETVFELLKSKREDGDEAKLAGYAKTISALKGEDGKYTEQEDAELDEETYILYALEDLETEGEEINADEVYSEMEKELSDMLEKKEITQEEFDDAKLSTEQRKKLSKSTFCGPDRSFPVPDCAHVTAARRLIGRYKGPGSKTAILACVSRKAKALGCDSAPQEPVVEPQNNDDAPKTIKDMSDEEIQKMFHDAEAELIGRKLTVKRECSECASHAEKAKEAEVEAKKASDELETANSTLTILRDELRSEFANYKVVVDDSVQVRTELADARVELAAIKAVLAKKEESLDKAKETIQNAEDFDKQIEVYNDGVDLSEIFGKMNDGMVNDDPDGTVDSPVVNNDKDNQQEPEGLSATEQAIVERIREHLEDSELEHAKSLYARMINKGVLRDSVKWETISTADGADE